MLSENHFDYTSKKYLSYHHFLTSFGIDLYKIDPLKSDCSTRRYYRIFSDLGSHILMDSSEDPSITAFISMGNILKKYNLKSPQIFATDLQAGYLLIEDFGNYSLTKYLQSNLAEEEKLYRSCTKVLIEIAQASAPDHQIPNYDIKLLNNELEVFCHWYLKQRVDPKTFTKAHVELIEIFGNLFKSLSLLPQVLTLRDFMADNIMVIENEVGLNKIGLIDFQDAAIGACVYDLVSLLEDARRDVSSRVTEKCKSMFRKSLKLPPDHFESGYAILGLQRNLKIVGIFHRMNLRDNKPSYLGYLPRVWKHILNALSNDIAHPLKQWFCKYDVYNK